MTRVSRPGNTDSLAQNFPPRGGGLGSECGLGCAWWGQGFVMVFILSLVFYVLRWVGRRARWTTIRSPYNISQCFPTIARVFPCKSSPSSSPHPVSPSLSLHIFFPPFILLSLPHPSLYPPSLSFTVSHSYSFRYPLLLDFPKINYIITIMMLVCW